MEKIRKIIARRRISIEIIRRMLKRRSVILNKRIDRKNHYYRYDSANGNNGKVVKIPLNKIDKMSIVDVIETIKKSTNSSNTELATKIGLPRQSVYDWIGNRHLPNMGNMAKLLDLLCCLKKNGRV